MAERIERAAYNNAVWCDAVCRSHRIPGEFLDGIWVNRCETPPFYPNAVTLKRQDTAVQLGRIDDLVAARPAGLLTIKDSFAAVDLRRLGFRVLFEAEWIWRAVSNAPSAAGSHATQWRRASTPSELADWESAWAAVSGNAQSATRAHIFRPALLADDDVAILGAYRGDRLIAGIIANRTREVVGVSNLFCADDAAGLREACIGAIGNVFPGLSLVGYESGGDLAAMRALGFESAGQLRVWIRDP